MSSRLIDWQRRLKAVEREYTATNFAVDRLASEAKIDPTVLTKELRVRDLHHSLDRLSGTYVVRLFAEFETCLRKFRKVVRKRPKRPTTFDLIESVATREKISDDWKDEAHQVREYRNSLVHERDEEVAPISVGETGSRLLRFLSCLPQVEEW